MTVDTNSAHGLTTGNRIQIADNSLTFTCAYDSNATQHTYPRQTDPIRGEWIEVTVVCLLYTSPSPRDATLSRMPSSA